jgi:hypothetical protein
MKCTRCKNELIEGENIYENWHIPICKKCRLMMIENGTWGTISGKEAKIMQERYDREDRLLRKRFKE